MNRHFHGVGKEVVVHLINAYILFVLGVREGKDANFGWPPTRPGDLAPSVFHQSDAHLIRQPFGANLRGTLSGLSGQIITDRF